MEIVTTLITYDRLDLTKKTLESYIENTQLPNAFVVVDNASTDGTREYLQERFEQGGIDRLVLNEENLYPGAACNMGWEIGLELLPNAELLHRCDNDLEFRSGWDLEVQECFEAFSDLGQLGTMNQEQEFYPEDNVIQLTTAPNGKSVNTHWNNIGGPNVLRRSLWDEGLRYRGEKWYHNGAPTAQEDVHLSLAVRAHGMFFANMLPLLVWHLGDRAFMLGEHEDYYRQTFTERGYNFDNFVSGANRTAG